MVVQKLVSLFQSHSSQGLLPHGNGGGLSAGKQELVFLFHAALQVDQRLKEGSLKMPRHAIAFTRAFQTPL